jgi:hypothetical protein
MWIFSKQGFFSIVKKKYLDQPKPYQIRARSLNDLENLIKAADLEEEIIETPYADYFFRIIADQADLEKIFNILQKELKYENFKNMVGRHEDQRDKLDAYHKIWKTMYNYQNEKR